MTREYEPVRELQAALARLCDSLAPIDRSTTVATVESWGSILARDLPARVDVPAFDSSMVDGFALRAADCSEISSLRVAGSALAGHALPGGLAPGTAARIMTGASLPDGADAVVMRESAKQDGDQVAVECPVAAGANVRRRGAQIRTGETVLRAGTWLDAAAIGLATAAGAHVLTVACKLRVGIASTGDELLDPPAPLPPRCAYDGSRPLLAAACRRSGFDVVDLGVCPDDAERFTQLVDDAHRRGLDVLLVCGGTGLGDADVVRKSASVQFMDLGLWPGRGVVFGNVGGNVGDAIEGRLALFGLPGYAVASFVVFHLIVRPALMHIAGGRARVPAHVSMPLGADAVGKPDRLAYLSARFEPDADSGTVVLRPLERQDPAMLRNVVESDALVAVAPGARYRAGDLVPALLLATLPH